MPHRLLHHQRRLLRREDPRQDRLLRLLVLVSLSFTFREVEKCMRLMRLWTGIGCSWTSCPSCSASASAASWAFACW